MKYLIALVFSGLLLFSGSSLGGLPQQEINQICTDGAMSVMSLSLLRDGGTLKNEILDKIYQGEREEIIDEFQAKQLKQMTDVVYKYPDQTADTLALEAFEACQRFFATDEI